MCLDSCGYGSHSQPLRQPAGGSALASLAHFVSRCLLADAGARTVMLRALPFAMASLLHVLVKSASCIVTAYAAP